MSDDKKKVGKPDRDSRFEHGEVRGRVPRREVRTALASGEKVIVQEGPMRRMSRST